MLESFWQDLRFGTRMLVKQPRFTITILVVLALGIGANTAIFSIVNSVLLRPLPYRNAERLVEVSETAGTNAGAIETTAVSLPDFLDWRQNNQVFEQMALYRWQAFSITGGADPEMLHGWYVTADFFPTLGVEAIKGRSFSSDEDSNGGARVVMISHALWQRRFGSDPAVVGQTINLNNTQYVVIGIAPAQLNLERNIDVYLPMALWADDMRSRSFRAAFVVARLKPNISIEQATANMSVLAAQLAAQYPDSNENVGASVRSLQQVLVEDIRTTLIILLGAVGLVLAIACVNVALLLTVRSAARQKEIAIRMALGIDRKRLIRQLLVEGTLISFLGGLLGLLLAKLTFAIMIASLPADLPRLEEIHMDGYVLMFTFALSVLTGVVFGLVPSIQYSRMELSERLKDDGQRQIGGYRSNKTRSILVVSEVALSVVLLVSSALLLKSLFQLIRVDVGFDPRNVLAMNVSLPFARYPKAEERRNFYLNLLQRVRNLPGVEGVAATNITPLNSEGYNNPVVVDGKPAEVNAPSTSYALVSPGYFETMKISLVRGRSLNERDVAPNPPVAVIDEDLAKRLFTSGEDPIGRKLKVATLADNGVEIVGIVKRVGRYGLNSQSNVHLYVPYLQAPLLKNTILVRTNVSDPLTLANAVRREVLACDPNQPIFNVRTLEQDMAAVVAPQRLMAILVSSFAGFALLLAAVGLHGVMSYVVEQRRSEIGVRIAIGAQRKDILRLIVGDGLKLTAIGLVTGSVLALLLGRVISASLYQVSAADPWTYAATITMLTFVSLAACYGPSRRALGVDPLVALRGRD
ncbi:MAG TPA: ABC transporter permease [Pyrinomonadaceae bacterium]|nr:ABC transporter permease [Pyrinomonadaceae bacterium]